MIERLNVNHVIFSPLSFSLFFSLLFVFACFISIITLINLASIYIRRNLNEFFLYNSHQLRKKLTYITLLSKSTSFF